MDLRHRSQCFLMGGMHTDTWQYRHLRTKAAQCLFCFVFVLPAAIVWFPVHPVRVSAGLHVSALS